jgi:5-methylthioadenosine/S-adenosylhomocysteine deaminase
MQAMVARPWTSTASVAANRWARRPRRSSRAIDSAERSATRRRAFRRLAGGEAVRTDELSPARLLEFATAGGAANAGLADQVGSLTPGKQADIVLIDTTRRPALPPADPTGAVTSFAGVGDVDTVLIAGAVRKRHGQLVGVDLAAARALAAGSREYLLSAPA